MICVYTCPCMCVCTNSIYQSLHKKSFYSFEEKIYITMFLKMEKLSRENYGSLDSWIQNTFLEKYTTTIYQCAQGTGTLKEVTPSWKSMFANIQICVSGRTPMGSHLSEREGTQTDPGRSEHAWSCHQLLWINPSLPGEGRVPAILGVVTLGTQVQSYFAFDWQESHLTTKGSG